MTKSSPRSHVMRDCRPATGPHDGGKPNDGPTSLKVAMRSRRYQLVRQSAPTAEAEVDLSRQPMDSAQPRSAAAPHASFSSVAPPPLRRPASKLSRRLSSSITAPIASRENDVHHFKVSPTIALTELSFTRYNEVRGCVLDAQDPVDSLMTSPHVSNGYSLQPSRHTHHIA